MIQIGLTADKYQFLSISFVLGLYKLCGISFSEVTTSVFDHPHSCFKHTRDMKLGLHLPNYGNCGYDLSSYQAREQISKLIQKMKTFHAYFQFEYAVFHPPQDETSQHAYTFFLQNLKKMPYALILENVREMNILEFHDYYKKLKRDLKNQLQGICLDIPHVFIENQDWEAYFRVFKRDIKVVHLSDCKNGIDSHLPFGVGGDLDLDSILVRLKQLGFSGVINFEILPPSLLETYHLFKNYLAAQDILQKENKNTFYSLKWIYLLSRILGIFSYSNQ